MIQPSASNHAVENYIADIILNPYYKKCSKCKLNKIIIDFQWSKHTDKIYGVRYYWSSICKTCDAKRRSDQYYAFEKNGLRKTEDWYKKIKNDVINTIGKMQKDQGKNGMSQVKEVIKNSAISIMPEEKNYGNQI